MPNHGGSHMGSTRVRKDAERVRRKHGQEILFGFFRKEQARQGKQAQHV